MNPNRIAIYGHRGWASSAIVRALAKSPAHVKVLFRTGSDTSAIPEGIQKLNVDVEDHLALINALEDIDIVLSLVGHEGIQRQHAFIRAIPHTNVKLFVPSDLAFRCEEQGLQIPVNRAKREVELAAKQAGIPTTVVLPGFFAESTLGIGLLGIDMTGNRIVFSGDSQNQPLNLCTREYVAAAYVSIFAATPLSQIDNRLIGLSELQVTGSDIARFMKMKHGFTPEIFKHSLAEIDVQIQKCLDQERPLAMAWYCRRAWGSGLVMPGIGTDIWRLESVEKATLEDLIVRNRMESYREPPPQLLEALNQTFF